MKHDMGIVRSIKSISTDTWGQRRKGERGNQKGCRIICHPLHLLPEKTGRFDLRWLKQRLTEPVVPPAASAATPAEPTRLAAAAPATCITQHMNTVVITIGYIYIKQTGCYRH